MGGSSPSNDAADSVSDGGRASYARATQQARSAQARINRQKSEEARVRSMNPSAYVTSGGGENIVRSSSGRGVLAGRQGQQTVERARQEELEMRLPTAEARRESAIVDLMGRREKTLPSILGVMNRMSIDQQLKQLRAGGTPQFSLTSSGGYVQTGIVPKGQRSDSTPNIPNIGTRVDVARNQDRGDRTPEVTPLDTGEIAPDDTSSIQTALLSGGSKTKRTRFKRPGLAGDLAGTGALVRNTTV